jgi:hypothetical protein
MVDLQEAVVTLLLSVVMVASGVALAAVFFAVLVNAVQDLFD